MNTIVDVLNVWGPRFTGFALPMLLQASVLILLLLLLEVVLRKRVRATVRHGLWLLVLVKLVLPPSLASPASVAYWLPAASRVPSKAALPLPAPALPPGPVVSEPLPGPAIAPLPGGLAERSSALTWPAFGLLAWLAGLAGLAGWVLWRCGSVRRMISRSSEAPPPTLELLESCRREMGLRGRIALRCAGALGSPAICGLFRPVILLPTALPGRLTPGELRAVLLHELAHLKRGDLWLRHVQTLLQVFYWYNPLLWVANGMLRRLREQAVDEMVLVELREEAAVYPATLLQVAKLMLNRPAVGLGLLGILESGSALAQRIRQIIDRPLPRTATLGIRGASLVGLIGLVALPMAGPRELAAAEAPPAAPRTADAPTKPPDNPPPLVPAPAPLPPRPVPGRYGYSGPAIELPVPKLMLPRNYVPPNRFMAGMALSAEEAEELEAKLAKTPDDLATREKLIGYYHHAQPFSARARTARVTHALWVIEHHPEAYMPAFENIMRFQDGAAFEQASAFWLKHVKANPNNAAVLAHAASYAPLPDGQTAESLLTRAVALEPKNPGYLKGLGQVYASQAGAGDTAEKRALAQKALALLEEAQANTSGEQSKFYNLRELAQTAFAAGDLQKARTYARDLLEQSAEAEEKHWGAGETFKGHVILGRVALREGNLVEAKKQLLEASDVTSAAASGTLTSFGPNMALAKELLEKGEKETVLEFLKRCREFWSSGKEKLDAWSWEISQGEVPDFGANLLF